MSQIIDFHTHIYPDWLRSNRESYLKQDITFGELFSHAKSKMVTADELIKEMNEQKVILRGIKAWSVYAFKKGGRGNCFHTLCPF